MGNAPLVFGAAVVSTILFGAIAREEWGESALWPTRIFAVCAAAPLFTGLYSYSFGFMLMLGAVRALQVRRTWLAVALAALTLGCSPLAFVFLCLFLGSVAVARRRLSGVAVRVGCSWLVIAAFELSCGCSGPMASTRSIGSTSPQSSVSLPPGILLARRARNGAPIFAFFALWAAGSIVASVVGSPIGRQLDTPERVRVPSDAADGSLGRVPAARIVAVARSRARSATA